MSSQRKIELGKGVNNLSELARFYLEDRRTLTGTVCHWQFVEPERMKFIFNHCLENAKDKLQEPTQEKIKQVIKSLS